MLIIKTWPSTWMSAYQSFCFQALCGCTVKAPTLDGRTITVTSRDIVKPGTKKRVSGEGLPLSKFPEKRGDMILDFTVKFPDKLAQSTRDTLEQILPL